MIEARYDYAGPFKSAQHADDVLADMFNTDEVCEGERPEIVSRKPRIGGRYVTRWYSTLPM